MKEETEQKKLFDIDLKEREFQELGINEIEMKTIFDISDQIRLSISEAVKQCSHSRAVIAARLSDILGVHITEHMLNAWSAESKDGYRFPLEYTPAFCYVTGDSRLVKLGPSVLGLKVLENREIMWFEYYKIREIEKNARAQRKSMERRLKGEKNG